MKILYATPEVVPFSKTGGLADVSGALPAALARSGHEVLVFTPLHGGVDRAACGVATTGKTALVAVAGRMEPAELHAARPPGAPAGLKVILVGNSRYFDRPALYGDANGDYADNAERFAFFSRAVLDGAKALGFKPDIIHGNDWQTGPLFAYLKKVYAGEPLFAGVKSVLTIHNMGYQGLFDPVAMDVLMLGWELFHYQALEFYGKVNYLKAGLVFADAISTVSRRYAEEIRTQEFGCGLDGVLEERRAALFGILNGVDYGVWSPENDPHIVKRFAADDLSGKAACKADLQAAFGLPKGDVPVIGIISRLADQKGFDLLAEIGDKIAGLRCQLVVLGSGDRKHQDYLTDLCSRHHGKVGVVIGFDDALAHKIEAGSDLFLMPSRYEPCGLNQMYSLRYGTIPIVRAVGGLDDTIEDFDAKAGTGNGFKFTEYSPSLLLDTIKRALDTYRKRGSWQALVARAMAYDFSWDASAKNYVAMYETMLKA